jgi:hypothetical protein
MFFMKNHEQEILEWDETVLIELSLHSPSVSPPISSAFAPYRLFQWYPQSKEILLNLGMKCWNSAFNAQSSRVIIVIVQVWEVKIYVAAMQALRKKETQDETQFTTKIGGKTSLGPSYFIL